MKWSEADRKRTQGALKIIAAHNGGWSGIAEKLSKPTQEMARQTPHSWYERGRVPLEHVRAVIALAPKELTNLKPSHLCPEARHLEEQR